MPNRSCSETSFSLGTEITSLSWRTLRTVGTRRREAELEGGGGLLTRRGRETARCRRPPAGGARGGVSSPTPGSDPRLLGPGATPREGLASWAEPSRGAPCWGTGGSLMGWSADCRCEQGVGDTYACSPQNEGCWRHLEAGLQLCKVTPTAAAVGGCRKGPSSAFGPRDLVLPTATSLSPGHSWDSSGRRRPVRGSGLAQRRAELS